VPLAIYFIVPRKVRITADFEIIDCTDKMFYNFYVIGVLELIFAMLAVRLKFTSMPDFAECSNGFAHDGSITGRTGSLRCHCYADTQTITAYHVI
jgi:hypothetical protein